MYYLIIQRMIDKPIIKEFESEAELKKHCLFNSINAKLLTSNVYFVHSKIEAHIDTTKDMECGL